MNINSHLITFDLVSSIAIARNEIPRTDWKSRAPTIASNQSDQTVDDCDDGGGDDDGGQMFHSNSVSGNHGSIDVNRNRRKKN